MPGVSSSEGRDACWRPAPGILAAPAAAINRARARSRFHHHFPPSAVSLVAGGARRWPWPGAVVLADALTATGRIEDAFAT
jgi:hypothetical protein